MKKYVIGLDFGTDSVRAVLVDTSNGKEVATDVHFYQRWKEGLFCDPSINQFRQHSLDHIEGMEASIRNVIINSGIVPKKIIGICIDTTGSSPLPVDKHGTALSLLPEFENEPDAMMVLWKDHTAISEADEINELAKNWGGEDYTKFEGGIYSSEWFWAKILHISRKNNEVKKAAYSWMEHCDYMTFLLVENQDLKSFKRSRCAAGHKAMWHQSWNGLPEDKFLAALDEDLVNIKNNLYTETYTSDISAGNLSIEWATKLGLTTDTIIAVGTFDAHAGAIGAEAKEGTLVRVMGTSTCDIIVSSKKELNTKTVKGICGQVDGSVIPNMIGLEAGQSAFGDVLAWFKNVILEPVDDLIESSTTLNSEQKQKLSKEFNTHLIEKLTTEAENLPIGESVPIALDWINGRRTPDANQNLKSAMTNLSLGTKAPHIFKALVEAICFGSKKIVDRFESEGVKIDEIVGIGGVAKKSSFVMQTLANVLNMPIKVANSEQAPALGAAMYAAVASGVYDSVEEAIQLMGNGFVKTYHPQHDSVKIYQKLYSKYEDLGRFVEGEKITEQFTSKYQLLKEECYEANIQLNELGLVVYTFGNVSCVDRKNKVFAIKPSGVRYEDLSPDDIVIVDFDNNIVEGKMRPSSDTKTHAFLYKNWKEIGGISHTHATYSVSWAQAQQDIPIFGTTHADHLTHDIPCAASMSDELIKGNYEHNTGQQILDCFADKKLSYTEVEMILIGNHGPFTWGETGAKAVYNSRVLEEIAKMAFLTRQINLNAPRLKDALINKHYDRKHGKDAYYGQNE
jgi:L-ribulokinase